MVDDSLDVQKCGVDAIKSNALINTFKEHKKLSMGKFQHALTLKNTTR